MTEFIPHVELQGPEARQEHLEVVDTVESVIEARTNALTLFHAALHSEPFGGWDVRPEADLGVVHFVQDNGSESSVVSVAFREETSIVMLTHEYIKPTESGVVRHTQNRTLLPASSEKYAFTIFTPKRGQRRFYTREDLLPKPVRPYSLDEWEIGLGEIASERGKPRRR